MAAVFSGSKQVRKHLEIILDSPFVVFHGDSHEAEPACVTGKLVLDTTDHINVRSIKVKIEGKRRVGWTSYGSALSGNPTSTQMIRDKGHLLDTEKQLVPAAGAATTIHRIAPGRHEWRFEFMLDPNLPESIEGLSGNYIVYNLSAEIDRGYISKSWITTKHVRLIRTLSRDMTETVPFPYVGHCTHATRMSANVVQSNEDTWADKIKYHIFTPSRYFAFGTSIPVQFTLIPLRKGIKIGKIKLEVIERVTLEAHKDADEVQTTSLSDRTVAKFNQSQIPEESTNTLIEESSGIADESYHFTTILPLSKSLNHCRQSVSTENIKVLHNLKICVNIHNPDGHVSQLCLRNLIHLYISPNTRINDDQTLIMSDQPGSDPMLSPNAEAPPTYGTHLLDQLYDDIDLAGFHSEVATPNLLSRNQSMENLAARFTGMAGSSQSSESDSSRSSSIAEPIATQLHNRLNALSTSTGPTVATQSRNNKPVTEAHSGRPSLWAGMSSLRNSIVLPRRRRGSDTLSNHPCDSTSQQPTADTIFQHPRVQQVSYPRESASDNLSRIPSYNTAVSRPYVAHTVNENADTNTELPTYEDAISVANSPEPSPQ